MPLFLLAVAYLRGSQETIAFARHELAGVEVLIRLEPWMVEVQKQRRELLSGASTRLDMNAVAGAMKAVHDVAASQPDAMDVTAELALVERLHNALAADAGAAAKPEELGPRLQAYIEAIRDLRTTVMDRSNLTLDPDQDTYYLMTLATDTVSTVIESISRSQALAGAAGRSGSVDAASLRALYGVWYVGSQHLRSVDQAVARAAEANAEVRSRLKTAETVQAAQAFFDTAARTWFDGDFNAATQQLDRPGQAAVDDLRELSRQSTAMLGELLQARIDRTSSSRSVMLAVVAVSLLMGCYLFYAFFLVMRGGMREVGRHLAAMTDGDLTTSPRPWGKDEAAELMLMLAAMQASLRAMVHQVRTSSEGIVHASTEIADGSMDLSARTEQTAANLEQSAAAMEQISATVRQTMDNTGEATRIASHNEVLAGRGGTVIADMVSTMDSIQASSHKINDIIGVIGVIDSIAFQTNILALNAAVEAARAGEQGRGFAVVATEVRALAQRSAGAAREIKGLISASVEKVDAGTSVVRQAGSTMQEIVGSARRINTLLGEISRGAQEQNEGIGQIGSSVQELDRATQQNAAMVEETAAAAASLRDQAHGLADEVARFRMPA
ncbi:MAG: hypothetical protein EOP35_17580 [Rubrivivax sp.]|nr:MAG: hypothetical protein EOP35_17580 [Rubrivivax sp.]